MAAELGKERRRGRWRREERFCGAPSERGILGKLLSASLVEGFFLFFASAGTC